MKDLAKNVAVTGLAVTAVAVGTFVGIGYKMLHEIGDPFAIDFDGVEIELGSEDNLV